MNNSKERDTEAARPAEQQLQAYLDEAVDAGANAVVLEYLSSRKPQMNTDGHRF